MNILALFEKIKVFVFDIDGVLTDGSLLVQPEGEFLRIMNIKDGYALQLAIKKKYEVWVISGGRSTACKKRLEKLGVKEVHIGIPDKLELLQSLLQSRSYATEEILYMGDDMPDLKVMQHCGLPTCPADAADEVRSMTKYTSPHNGGKGCVRDVIEKVLKINGDWE